MKLPFAIRQNIESNPYVIKVTTEFSINRLRSFKREYYWPNGDIHVEYPLQRTALQDTFTA